MSMTHVTAPASDLQIIVHDKEKRFHGVLNDSLLFRCRRLAIFPAAPVSRDVRLTPYYKNIVSADRRLFFLWPGLHVRDGLTSLKVTSQSASFLIRF